ncbi:hypothetical protein EUTSA_v10021834mg [Eutrema salsugineum]|uniref:Bifunctional inhibitor/plant lipid transfer protein/seed storage helical domain-containing protein n=1 Tax=Eutrema salsugineum TaxID=72664 RepID=V4NQB7_EUTSA|nr:hypothetical protein EUTSA_v10021834mg [Eutrema salsugineum]
MKIISLMSITMIVILLMISFLDPIKSQGIVGCDSELDKCITAMNEYRWFFVWEHCCSKLNKKGPQPCMCLFFKYPALKQTALKLINYCKAPIPKC